MTIELNHTIVPAHDPKASARFLADILGLRVGPPVALAGRVIRLVVASPGW
jgi:catechol 2,3-dioxygenase-like lactoylglutathione lyase family enzyme